MKTADQILFEAFEDGKRVERGEKPLITQEQAKRQLFDAFMAIIGEDEKPDTMVRAGAPIKGQPRQYKPHYSLRAQFINETKAAQRARARRFFNIPEAEQQEKP